MNLETHYDQLYQLSLPKIATGNVEVDDLLNSESDTRFGITLLIRPPEWIKNNIQEFLSHLKTIEPDQYYYRNSDMHVTVLSIISCYAGFNLNQIKPAEYVAVIQKSLSALPKFSIQFKGITASSSSVLIQGFLPDNTLNRLRDQLRINFKNSGLEQTIDKRYAIQTAHTTIARFRKNLAHTSEFIQVLNKYRQYEFGTFTVDAVELVFNDWYQRTERVKQLYTFPLTP